MVGGQGGGGCEGGLWRTESMKLKKIVLGTSLAYDYKTYFCVSSW